MHYPPLSSELEPLGSWSFDFSRPGEVVYGTAFEDELGITMQYGLDDSQINRHLGTILPSTLADLIDVAVAVHVSDRLAVRRRRKQGSECRREIKLVVPVRNTALWRRDETGCLLRELLEFLTEDEWSIDFCQRPNSVRTAESQQHLFSARFDGPVHVGLFSGGLDSFAGTAAVIGQHPDTHFVCVSGVPNQRHGERQRKQVACLKKLKPASLTHVRVACWLRRSDEVEQEPTRRTRGFLFLALGAASVFCAEADCLWLYENGIGSVNLPYQRAEIGVSTARSVHPHTLNLMASFASVIADREFTIRNGSVFETKAQMCTDKSVQRVAEAIRETFSCDGFPLRKRGSAQCGVCTSCLLRRMALYHAGFSTLDREGYRDDVYSASFNPGIRGQRGMYEMNWQVARLKAGLVQPDPWLGLVSEFPDIVAAQQAICRQLGVAPDLAADRLVQLYRRHCDEWTRFPAASLAETQRKAA